MNKLRCGWPQDCYNWFGTRFSFLSAGEGASREGREKERVREREREREKESERII